MKLLDVLIAATATLSIFAVQQIAAEDNVAACCSDFDADCYTMASNRSNNHACSQCVPTACSEECGPDYTSEVCEACCVSYPQHGTPWECPVQSITCLADDYGIGNYSDFHDVTPMQCPSLEGDGDVYFDFSLTNAATTEECLLACESSGVPGCCDFVETIDTEQNTTVFSDCRFRSSVAATFAELKNAKGTEPIPVPRRLLMSTKNFYRAVRCEKTPTEETDSPSTKGPTTPGSDAGATQISASIAVVCAVVLALKAL